MQYIVYIQNIVYIHKTIQNTVYILNTECTIFYVALANDCLVKNYKM